MCLVTNKKIVLAEEVLLSLNSIIGNDVQGACYIMKIVLHKKQ